MFKKGVLTGEEVLEVCVCVYVCVKHKSIRRPGRANPGFTCGHGVKQSDPVQLVRWRLCVFLTFTLYMRI